MGRVFNIGDPFIDLYRQIAPEFEKDPLKMNDVLKPVWMKECRGELEPDSFWRSEAEYLGVDEDCVLEPCIRFYPSRPEVIGLAKELKKKYSIALLTNNIERWLKEDLRRNGLITLFDTAISSHSCRKAKPNPKIYRHIRNKLNIKGEGFYLSMIYRRTCHPLKH
ncbi:MAG: HAD family hydrolase [Candidatus Nanoarchaeia archaeon]